MKGFVLAVMLVGCALASFLGLRHSQAEDMIGNPVAGHELALNVCSECHWASEEQFVIPENEAPSFFQLADDPAYTPIGLRVALQTPHNNMPNLMLTPQETDDVIAYIMELREQR